MENFIFCAVFVLSIDKLLIIETFENEFIWSHTKYQITFFKNHWKSKFNISEVKKEEESVRKKKTKKLIET